MERVKAEACAKAKPSACKGGGSCWACRTCGRVDVEGLRRGEQNRRGRKGGRCCRISCGDNSVAGRYSYRGRFQHGLYMRFPVANPTTELSRLCLQGSVTCFPFSRALLLLLSHIKHCRFWGVAISRQGMHAPSDACYNGHACIQHALKPIRWADQHPKTRSGTDTCLRRPNTPDADPHLSLVM